MLAIIEEGVNSGAIAPRTASPRMIATAIVGMCNWSHRWFRPDGKSSAEEIGEKFDDIILHGILAE